MSKVIHKGYGLALVQAVALIFLPSMLRNLI